MMPLLAIPKRSSPGGTKDRGFTLLEMSIVLTIIGLIAGGIMVGKSLVRGAEMRSMMNDVNRFKSAVETFKLKYSALPGDFMHATDIWGIAGGSGSDSTCYATDQRYGTATCNGTGDGHIGTTDVYNGRHDTEEWFLAWKHLSNAGLVKGLFTGTAGSGGITDSIPGQNVPATRIAGGGFTLFYVGQIVYGGNMFLQNYGHIIVAGAPFTPYETSHPLMTAIEAKLIDTKNDDGLPATGFITTQSWDVGGCITSSDPTVADYNTALSGNVCFLQFTTGF